MDELEEEMAEATLADSGGIPEEEEKLKKIGDFMMGKLIGEGAFSQVKVGYHIVTGAKVAIKIVQKDRIKDFREMERNLREMRVLKNLNHPSIIKMYDCIDKTNHMYIMMEFAGGGELADFIREKPDGRVPENEAKKIFRSIIGAVEYCHKHGVAHRDLKPENVLLDEHGNTKVVDFGLSQEFVQGSMLKTCCGSPTYCAPEMTQGKPYDGPGVDVWACGVILYDMIVGEHPFDDDNQAELFRKIRDGSFTFPKDLSCSKDLKDLIRRFLTVDVAKRISIAEAWLHPWLKQTPGGDDFDMSDEEADESGKSEGHTKKRGAPKVVELELLQPHGIPAYVLSSSDRSETLLDWNIFTCDALFPPEELLKASETSTLTESKHMAYRLYAPPKRSRSIGGSSELAAAKSPSTAARLSQGKRPSVEKCVVLATLAAKPSASEVPADGGTSSATHAPTKALNLCVASKKPPHLVMREVQRAFAEYKVAMKASTPYSVKGDKQRVCFALDISELTKVNDNTLSEPIYLLRASRLSGDSVVYKELMRRLLAKVSHHSNTGVSKPTSDTDF